MTAASLLRDLTAFSMQIALVALGVAVLLKLVRIPAGARYLGLRLALVASLIVPWLLRAPEVQAPALATPATWAVVAAPVPATAMPSAPATRTATAGPPAATLPAIPWMEIGFGALLIGIAARVVWLGMGVLRLLRMKRDGVVVDAPEYSELQQQIGTDATISQVAGLPQPATFGVRRPTVLLPDALADAPASLRRAVVTHELFHVRRRDWLAVLTEEMVRTALWFHPGIHWMTAQIQLAREEIVDELTVSATGDRRTYVEALLAFADTPGLSPAPAFAHRRQLFHRILNVSKEKVMSRPKVVASVVALVTAVAAASWYGSALFPIVKAAKVETLSAQGTVAAKPSTQTVSRVVVGGTLEISDGGRTVRASELRLEQQGGNAGAARSVTPENPIPRRTRAVAPVMPSQYASTPVTVSARVTVDRNGAVTAVDPDSCFATNGRTDAAVCAAFQNAAAAAVRQWKYERPAQAPIQFYVRVAFRPGENATIAQSGESYLRQTQNSYLEQAQDYLRLADQSSRGDERVATDDFLKTQLDELAARFRELERAQRSAIERGSPNPDMLKLQAEMGKLNGDTERLEEQLRRSNSHERAEQVRALADQVRDAERQLEATRARLTVEDQARADEQRRRIEEMLREAQQRLEAARARMEQTGASRQLVSPSGRTPVRVGDVPGMKPPIVKKSVKPEHPLIAQSARVQGTVVLEALVDEQGRVADVRVTKSIPLLDQAAMDAARQWEFTPAMLNGEPVPTLVVLQLDFNLR